MAWLCGTSQQGLPIGLQVVAPPWCDTTTLEVALSLEKALGGYLAPKVPSL